MNKIVPVHLGKSGFKKIFSSRIGHGGLACLVKCLLMRLLELVIAMSVVEEHSRTKVECSRAVHCGLVILRFTVVGR